ncbi:MAG: phosphatase PAP2 family protein [Candidatus Zambryskibacteria bacterium]|nr:phosphatase PAP2 family protein [Candidatus Zambryskibacteria bacterium]
MDTISVFGAQYLWILSPFLALWYFLKLSKEKRKEFLICACVILPIAFLLGLLAKQLWLNPSPINPGENGFPSDHTLLIATLAALIMLFNKKLSVWLWIIAAIVASSRVYVGEHHLIDVIGSIVIALISAGIAYAIIRHIWNHNKTQNN